MKNGRYTIHEKLGQGGMGIVHRATDRLTGEIVALKQIILSENLQIGDTIVSRTTEDDLRLALANEFQILAGLRHPHIISVLDYGFDAARQPFFTMTYLPEAQNILEAGQNQPFERKVELIQQLLQALAYLHRRGVLHHDLKPDNVLVSNGTVRVLDFGLSVHEQQDGDSVGTPLYMAPELFDGEAYETVADLYAVGVLFCELLTGAHPFAPLDFAFLDRVTEAAPNLTGVAEEVRPFLTKLLAKQPHQRWQSANEAQIALAQAVGQQAPAETAAIRDSYLQAATFVGRETEMAQLQAALMQAQKGQGCVWLIGGESGVGKSRLINELRIQALVSGFLVLRGQGVADGASYQIWRRIIQRLALTATLDEHQVAVLQTAVPDLATQRDYPAPPSLTLSGSEGQARLFQALWHLFAQQERPIMLILEDLQWAQESLFLLNRLSAALSQYPLLICGTYRDDELPHLDIPLAKHIKLERLAPLEIKLLSQAMLGQAGQQPDVLELLQRESEGNTFFLIEVARALAEASGQLSQIGTVPLPNTLFPEGIRTIVQRRLAQVPLHAKELLVLAAVAGREIDIGVLTYLAERLPQSIVVEHWLVMCAETAVLEVADDQWRFSHDKLRDGLLSTHTDEERGSLHQKIAQAVEAIYPDNPDYAASLATHWREAQAWEKARHYAQIAAKLAIARFTQDEAIHYLTQAIELTPEDEWEARFELVRLRQDAYNTIGNRQKQQQDIDELRHIAGYLEHPRFMAELRLQQSQYAEQTSDYVAAATFAENAVAWGEAWAEESDNAPEAVRAIGRGRCCWGLALNFQSQYEAAKSQFQQALTQLETQSLPDRSLMANALNGLGISAFYQGEMRDSFNYWQATLEVMDETNNRIGAGITTNNLGLVLISLGELDQALDYLLKAVEIRQKVGDRNGHASSLSNLGFLFQLLGQYERAAAYLQEAIPILESTKSRLRVSDALGRLGELALARKSFTEAMQLFNQALTTQKEIGSPRAEGLLYGSLGRCYYLMGELAESETAYQKAKQIFEQLQMPNMLRNVFAGLAELSLAQGNLAQAQAYIQPLLPDLFTSDELDGTQNPFVLFKVGIQVLQQAEDDRLPALLQVAYRLLQIQANKIIDPDLRRSFLENIPSHRAIMVMYKEYSE